MCVERLLVRLQVAIKPYEPNEQDVLAHRGHRLNGLLKF